MKSFPALAAALPFFLAALLGIGVAADHGHHPSTAVGPATLAWRVSAAPLHPGSSTEPDGLALSGFPHDPHRDERLLDDEHAQSAPQTVWRFHSGPPS